MSKLKHKAQMALEGSDRSPEAPHALHAYIEDLIARLVLPFVASEDDNEFELGIELFAFLELLSAVVDPEGVSPYTIQISRRPGTTGRPPNPHKRRIRESRASSAAWIADLMLERDPAMQKKEANSIAASRLGVTVSELYDARKRQAAKN